MYYDQLNHPALNYATITYNYATFILFNNFLIMVFIKGRLQTTFNTQNRTQFKIPKTYGEHILQCNEKIHLVPIWFLRTPYIHSTMESVNKIIPLFSKLGKLTKQTESKKIQIILKIFRYLVNIFVTVILELS